jgi:hypothetical protein
MSREVPDYVKLKAMELSIQINNGKVIDYTQRRVVNPP